MSPQVRDYRVGIFIALGMGILGVLILLYGKEPAWFLTTRYDLRVLVESPKGIREGTPAFLQGVQVGRVEKITLQDPDEPSRGAAVILGIKNQFDIPSGWEAEINPVFGFGLGEVHVHRPKPLEGAPADRAKIVPLPKDGSATIQGEMVGALESIVPEEYVRNLGEAVATISDMAVSIEQTSDDLHVLLQRRPVDDVDDPEKDIVANASTLIQRTDETLRLLNQMLDGDRDGDLRALVTNSRKISDNLVSLSRRLDERMDTTLDHVDQSLITVRERADEISKQVVATVGQLGRVLEAISTVMAAVNEGKRTIGKAIYDEKLYVELIDTIKRMQRVLDELSAVIQIIEADGLRAIY